MNQTQNKQIKTPCCAVLGHVDVGKTKLLDLMRCTKTGEASGITQQIGTTLYSRDRLEQLVGKNLKAKINIDSLLMIDTPGHECFDTIRYVALMVTDVVILMVDMIKGLEKQTLHIISLLKRHQVPFIICVNKIDRIYGWVKPTSDKNLNLACVIKRMTNAKLNESFEEYIRKIQYKLYEYDVSSELYYQNKTPRDTINIVPISAETGEGVPDLVMLISVMAEKKYLSDKMLEKNLTYGYVLDTHYDKNGKYLVSLHRNGELNRGDQVVINNKSYKIKQLLTNSDNREIKDDHKFTRVDSVNRSVGFGMIVELDSTEKHSLEDEIDPASIYLLKSDSDRYVEDGGRKTLNTKDEYEARWKTYLCDTDTPGVQVVAPSYIMMDGLLHLLTSTNVRDTERVEKSKIRSTEHSERNVERYKVGRIDKKDIMISGRWHDKVRTSYISELTAKKNAVILSYDPSIESISKEIVEIADKFGVTILHSNVVYKLIDMYNEYLVNLEKQFEHRSNTPSASIQIIPNYVFRTSNPMLVGVKILDGTLKTGSSVYIDMGLTDLVGKVESMQRNKVDVDSANASEDVCIKIITTKQIDRDVDRSATLWVV